MKWANNARDISVGALFFGLGSLLLAIGGIILWTSIHILCS